MEESELTPGDRATVERFKEWLASAAKKSPEEWTDDDFDFAGFDRRSLYRLCIIRDKRIADLEKEGRKARRKVRDRDRSIAARDAEIQRLLRVIGHAREVLDDQEGSDG